MSLPRQLQQQQQQQTCTRNDDTRQPVVYTTLPRQQRNVYRYYESYCCLQSMCIGTTLLITGLLSIVLQSVSIAAGLILSTVCHGIWSGVMVSQVTHHSIATPSIPAVSWRVMSCDIL